MVDWHRNTHPSHPGGDHIPAQPFWVAIIRIVQGVFNLLVLSLAAHAASYYYLDGYGMAFFTFIWTVLFLLYIFLAPRFFPQLYFFWAHVAFEVLTVIWWLVTFALLAHYTRAWSGYYGRFWRGGMVDSTRAATAFAVLNWLLFCVTLAAILLLSSRATIDATHTHSTTTTSATTPTNGSSSFAAKFSSLFSRKPRTATTDTANPDLEGKPGGTELGTGPVHNNGVNTNTAPVGTNDYGAPYGAGTGNPAGYGQHWQGAGNDVAAPPPSAAAPHYGPGQQERY